MKHPLTSKERRGLVAVAAAALLCIGSGFIFRSCSSHGPISHSQVTVIDNDSVGVSRADSISGKSGKSSKSSKSEKSRKSKKPKSQKTYPSRSPLDQPIN